MRPVSAVNGCVNFTAVKFFLTTRKSHLLCSSRPQTITQHFLNAQHPDKLISSSSVLDRQAKNQASVSQPKPLHTLRGELLSDAGNFSKIAVTCRRRAKAKLHTGCQFCLLCSRVCWLRLPTRCVHALWGQLNLPTLLRILRLPEDVCSETQVPFQSQRAERKGGGGLPYKAVSSSPSPQTPVVLAFKSVNTSLVRVGC